MVTRIPFQHILLNQNSFVLFPRLDSLRFGFLHGIILRGEQKLKKNSWTGNADCHAWF